MDSGYLESIIRIYGINSLLTINQKGDYKSFTADTFLSIIGKNKC